MAKQNGIIPLQGSIDNISFYQHNGAYRARKKTAISAERFAKDPAFARTREQMSTFGKAGKAGKLLRTALRPLANQACDKQVVGRLVARMVQVIKRDATNPRGKKNVIDGETELLTGFEFNVNGRLTVSFAAPYEATIDRASGNALVKIPTFITEKLVTAPYEATHMQLNIGALEVNFENETYVAKFASSAYLSLAEKEHAAFDLSVALPPASTHPLFLAMGVSFSTEDLGEQYPIKNGAYNALAIIQVSGV